MLVIHTFINSTDYIFFFIKLRHSLQPVMATASESKRVGEKTDRQKINSILSGLSEMSPEEFVNRISEINSLDVLLVDLMSVWLSEFVSHDLSKIEILMPCLYMKLPRKFNWKMVRCYQGYKIMFNCLEVKASNSPFVSWDLSNEKTEKMLQVLLLSGCTAKHAIVDISCNESTIALAHKLAEKPEEPNEVSSLLDLCFDIIRRNLRCSCSHQMLINAGLPPKLCSTIRRDALIENVMSIIKGIKQKAHEKEERKRKEKKRLDEYSL